MLLNPLIAVHMTAALTAIAIGPAALWARKVSTQRPKLHRACLPSQARHGLIVMGFCLLIAVVVWLAKSGHRFDTQQVYSTATGLSSRLVTDLSRFFIDVKSSFGFARGGRGVAVILIGVFMAFVGGMLQATPPAAAPALSC